MVVYIFCNESNGYSQYPCDNSEQFLKQFCKDCRAIHQIAVHRDGNLMYYAYTFKTSEYGILGLCFTSFYVCTDIVKLFQLFAKVINDAAHNGAVMNFDKNGIVRLTTNDFSKVNGDLELLFKAMENRLNGTDIWENLPPEDFSIPLNSRVALNLKEDGNDKIVEATRHYHNVYVTLENTNPSSYAQTVKELNRKLDALNKENIKLTRQKKQYRTVLFLAMLLIIGGIAAASIIYGKNADILSQQATIASLNDTIMLKNSEIDTLSATVESQLDTITKQKGSIDTLTNQNKALNDKIVALNNLLNSLELEKMDLERQVASLKATQLPLIIESIEVANTYKNGNIETNYGEKIYSSKTMFLKPRIKYTANVRERITLKIKLYENGKLSTGDTSPAGYTNEYTFTLEQGSGRTVNLIGWGNEKKGQWRAGNYRYEIWYNGMCLKDKTFQIY